jgi:signal transduction histidine kinase
VNGNFKHYLGYNIDITERKQAEDALHEAYDLLEARVVERTLDLKAANLALEKAARLKDEFLSSMSHELRTPLSGILGLAEVMKMPHIGPLNAKQSTYIDHIYQSGQHLLHLINELLDISKIGAGKMELALAPCSLEEICQASLQMVSAQADAKKLEYSLSMLPKSIVLNVDAIRIKQVLVNLLGNAVKFTLQGGSFGLDVVGSEEAGEVILTVWDTGIGILEQDLPRLFQVFVQLDARLARQYEGSGMGLALVKSLVEMHGGKIAVQSVFGRGSRFTVILPWK